MREFTAAAISLALLAGCSPTKVNQTTGLVPKIQPISQASAPVQTVNSAPAGQWINLGNNGVVNVS